MAGRPAARLIAVVCAALLGLAGIVAGAALVTGRGDTGSPSVLHAQTLGGGGAAMPGDAGLGGMTLEPEAGAPAAPPPGAAAEEPWSLPTDDPYAPFEPYRKNPFMPMRVVGDRDRAEEQPREPRMVRVWGLGVYTDEETAKAWAEIKNRNMSYFELLEEADFGHRFEWGVTRFPRPSTVIQPVDHGPAPQLLPPPEWGGAGVGVAPPPTVEGPRPDVTAQPIGPRVTTKTATSRIRRVAGVIHDGVAAAIVEVDNNGRIERLLVKPGNELTVGGVVYRVRSIGEDEVVLVEGETGDEVRIPLRGRAANEF